MRSEVKTKAKEKRIVNSRETERKKNEALNYENNEHNFIVVRTKKKGLILIIFKLVELFEETNL